MILYSTTCIALACKSLTVVEIMISVFDKVENTVGKDEDTGRKYWQILATTIFSPSPTLFSNFIPFFPHYLLLDGILKIPNLSGLGMLGTEPDYFSTQQLLY